MYIEAWFRAFVEIADIASLYARYGVVLEKMQEQGEDVVGRIKGCVIDSAPVPESDPQVPCCFV